MLLLMFHIQRHEHFWRMQFICGTVWRLSHIAIRMEFIHAFWMGAKKPKRHLIYYLKLVFQTFPRDIFYESLLTYWLRRVWRYAPPAFFSLSFCLSMQARWNLRSFHFNIPINIAKISTTSHKKTVYHLRPTWSPLFLLDCQSFFFFGTKTVNFRWFFGRHISSIFVAYYHKFFMFLFRPDKLYASFDAREREYKKSAWILGIRLCACWMLLVNCII